MLKIWQHSLISENNLVQKKSKSRNVFPQRPQNSIIIISRKRILSNPKIELVDKETGYVREHRFPSSLADFSTNLVNACPKLFAAMILPPVFVCLPRQKRIKGL